MFILEFRLELELELGLKLEWLEGVSKTLGGLVYFLWRLSGRASRISMVQNTQAPPRVFDTPSSHSNFNPNSNSNSNLNSKIKTKNIFLFFPGLLEPRSTFRGCWEPLLMISREAMFALHPMWSGFVLAPAESANRVGVDNGIWKCI